MSETDTPADENETSERAYAEIYDFKGPSACVYITYQNPEHAVRAVKSLTNTKIKGRTIKVSLGTPKYCCNFLKNTFCPKSTLKRKEREYEHDMERLAREKIAFQQKLSSLKKDVSSQLDHVDMNNLIQEEDNETTTTASECGALSDFDDSLPRENSTLNSSSDFTSSSSSSTVSSVLVGPVPSTVSTASSFGAFSLEYCT